MREILYSETAFKRACKETEEFRNSAKSFWTFEIVGAAVFGLGGAYVGYLLMPAQPSLFQQFVCPGIGGVIGLITGLVIVFGLIFLWNLFRAPYRQRNEARNTCLKLETKLEDRLNRTNIRLEIGNLIIEGAEVLKALKSVHFLGDALPNYEFQTWRNNVTNILQTHNLHDDHALFFKDVIVDMQYPKLDDFKSACEAGLKRLENIIERLRD